jgi:hypothetical protein
MVRRMQRNDGLRELLIADDDGFRAAWRSPRAWDSRPPTQRELPMLDWDLALRAGQRVVVSSSRLLCALMRAGVPHREYAFGGRYCNSVFVLDEYDQLTVLEESEMSSAAGGIDSEGRVTDA